MLTTTRINSKRGQHMKDIHPSENYYIINIYLSKHCQNAIIVSTRMYFIGSTNHRYSVNIMSANCDIPHVIK